MESFATIDDVIALWRPLTEEETNQVNTLLPLVSNCLRYEADKVGKDLDQMIEDNAILGDVAKSVTIDVVRRYVNDTANDGASMSQMSESAGGYTVSGTFLVAGGGLFIKNTELKRLGLRRQKIGTLEIYGND